VVIVRLDSITIDFVMYTLFLTITIFAIGECQFDIEVYSKDFHKTYLFKDGWRDFNESVELCRHHGATLVHLRSKAELDFIDDKVTHYGFWIGSKPMVNGVPNRFFDGTIIEWIDWLVDSNNTYDCTVFGVTNRHSDLTDTRKWYTENCSNTRMVVCEKVTMSSLSQVVQQLFDKQRRTNQEVEVMKEIISSDVEEMRIKSDEIIKLKLNISDQILDNHRIESEIVQFRKDIGLLFFNLTQLN